MTSSPTCQTRPKRPKFRVFVYLPKIQGGALYTIVESHKMTDAEAISSARNKLYRRGISAHYYRYVAVNCGNQSSARAVVS